MIHTESTILESDNVLFLRKSSYICLLSIVFSDKCHVINILLLFHDVFDGEVNVGAS